MSPEQAFRDKLSQIFGQGLCLRYLLNMVLLRINISISIVIQVDPFFDPFKSVEEAFHVMRTNF